MQLDIRVKITASPLGVIRTNGSEFISDHAHAFMLQLWESSNSLFSSLYFTLCKYAFTESSC